MTIENPQLVGDLILVGYYSPSLSNPNYKIKAKDFSKFIEPRLSFEANYPDSFDAKDFNEYWKNSPEEVKVADITSYLNSLK